MKADKASMIPAPINTHSLYVDTAVIHGTAPTNPANAAPIPNVTSNAGSAQHTSVPMLVKRLRVGITVYRHTDGSGLFDTVYAFHIIARIRDQLCYALIT